LRYVLHNDKRQAGAKIEIQHFIKAPSDEIAINDDIIAYKNVSQEPDTASASVKKQRFGVMFFIMTKDKPGQKSKFNIL